MFRAMLFIATGVLLIATCVGQKGIVMPETICNLDGNVLTMTSSLRWDDTAIPLPPIVLLGSHYVYSVVVGSSIETLICSGNEDDTVCSSPDCTISHTFVSPTHDFNIQSSVDVTTGIFTNNPCAGNIEINSNQTIEWTVTWALQFRTTFFALPTDPDPVLIICRDDENTGTGTAGGDDDDNSITLDDTDIENESERETFSAVLEVTRSGTPLTAGDTVSLDEDVKLRATLSVINMVKGLSVWGAYYFNCVAAPTEADLTSDGGTRVRFIGSDGCPSSSIINTGFTQTSYSDGSPYTQVSETSVFKPFSFVGKANELWFLCRLHICTGPFQQSAKCKDFCSTNTKRKKRQANGEEQYEMKTFIRLRSEETGSTKRPMDNARNEPQASSEEPQPMNVVVIAAASAVGCLFLLVLFVACLAFCILRRRRERVRNETYRKFPSPSSSISSVSGFSNPAPF